MRNRDVGLILLGVVVLMGFMVFAFNTALMQIVNESCTHGPSCPMWGNINFQTTVSIALMVIVLAVAAYLIYTDRTAKPTKQVSLHPDEKKVYDAVASADGSIFQSELPEKTGLNKVQITRILDRLEGRGLISRMRRGMTNVVLLK